MGDDSRRAGIDRRQDFFLNRRQAKIARESKRRRQQVAQLPDLFLQFFDAIPQPAKIGDGRAAYGGDRITHRAAPFCR